MDFATLQARLLARLSMGSNDPSAADAPNLINEGLHYVDIAHPGGWPWLRRRADFTVTSATDAYAFATIDSTNTVARILELRLLRDQYYNPLTLTDADEADWTWPYTNGSEPRAYFVEGRTVYIRPTPDTTYTVRARTLIYEPELSAGTDTPLMPSAFHTSIVCAGLVLYYETLQDSQRVQLAQTQLNDWINRMMRASREYSGGPRIKVRETL